jgi:hypothetical protein
MSKIPVYFMPGLAASAQFLSEYNFLKLILKCIYGKFRWLRSLWTIMPRELPKKRPGVNRSFVWRYSGSEMAKHINTRKVIIISSVKSNLESPKDEKPRPLRLTN